MIELFVRSKRIVTARDAETLGHACAGPGAQMRAASAAHSVTMLREEDRDAVERVRALANSLHEELVVWDLATRPGRKAARLHRVHATPVVVSCSGTMESVDAFQARAETLLRAGAIPNR